MSNKIFTLMVAILLAVNEETIGFDVTLLHTNDIHARVEQINKYGGVCSAKNAADGACYGGVARRKTKVQEIRDTEDNVLLLDAGDQFLGTLWFNQYKGLADSFFMKQIGYDIMCLGNHEFDLGVGQLATFLDNVTFPVVCANMDVTNESPIRGKFTKSKVLAVGGEQIGVIGFLSTKTAVLSNTGPTVTLDDEISSVKAEADKLTEQGVNKIIALGHSGYEVDKDIAAIENIDVVIGGHTHTFLYTGEGPSNEVPEGDYPTIVTKPSGKKGYVVHDFKWGKYLGYLKVTFDGNGDVTEYSGNPILLNNSVLQDPAVLQLVNEWVVPINALNTEVVGRSKVLLDGARKTCRLYECNMGNLITDAIIDYHVNFTHPNNTWAPAAIAVWNGGDIRDSIGKGPITIGEIMSVLPYRNEIDLIRVKGSNLRAMLELSVRDWDPEKRLGRFLQYSGLRVVYNLLLPPGEKLVSVNVRCLECAIPSYSPLQDDAEYNLFISNFLRTGGDGYKFEPLKIERFNTLDTDVMTTYFRKYSPVFSNVEGRIQFRNTDDVSAAILNCEIHVILLIIMTSLSLFSMI